MSDKRCETCAYGHFHELHFDGSCQARLSPEILQREIHMHHPWRMTRRDFGAKCDAWAGKDKSTD